MNADVSPTETGIEIGELLARKRALIGSKLRWLEILNRKQVLAWVTMAELGW